MNDAMSRLDSGGEAWGISVSNIDINVKNGKNPKENANVDAKVWMEEIEWRQRKSTKAKAPESDDVNVGE